MNHSPAEQPLSITLFIAWAARLGTSVGRFIARFDRSDGHFYGGLSLLFAGIWQMSSLGLALTVCGGLLCAVGLMGALFSAAPTAPGAQPPNRKTG